LALDLEDFLPRSTDLSHLAGDFPIGACLLDSRAPEDSDPAVEPPHVRAQIYASAGKYVEKNRRENAESA
jgi:hypothetical protein